MKYGYILQLLIDGLGKHYSKQQNMVTKDHMASLIAHLIKNLPAMQETWVRFLGWEAPLEKEMAIHFSILAWKIPWTEEPGGLQPMGSQESDLATKPPPLEHKVSRPRCLPFTKAPSSPVEASEFCLFFKIEQGNLKFKP